MNNLYTLSYFRKRLRDSGISSRILINDYAENDPRYWTISCFSDKHILCTCIRDDDDVYFEFYDSGVRLGNTMIVRTKSMNVIISELIDWVSS